MYIVQAKSGEGAEQACTYFLPSLIISDCTACMSDIRCLPFRHLLTCTPQPPLPATPAQASVYEKSGEVSRLQALSSDPAAEF